MKILLVDDQAKIRQLVQLALNVKPEDVIEASDGLQALQAYPLHKPGLVIMDIRMPHMDGLAATRQLTSRYPEAKVLMLTDYDDDVLRDAAFKAGARGYALKQNISDLRAVVDGLI